ncbi:hypothetical protein E2C01_064592 [Portunus trituberculatus]|uniref:Uncharacterized protein n=1 Tax=Portunus trituberculatus TaxID=210409 RepID=A0A5B7HNS6_PORTR|nr:hypothetical protein [Portunus trituberculatus]
MNPIFVSVLPHTRASTQQLLGVLSEWCCAVRHAPAVLSCHGPPAGTSYENDVPRAINSSLIRWKTK